MKEEAADWQAGVRNFRDRLEMQVVPSEGGLVLGWVRIADRTYP